MDLFRILFVTIIGCLALAKAAPQGPDKDKAAQIVRQESELNPDGSYKYSYETDNGIKVEENAAVEKASGANAEDSLSVQGAVAYKDNEGNDISWTYKADANGGFVAVGSHIPTPPPIPEAILKSLEYNAAHPEEDEQPPKGR